MEVVTNYYRKRNFQVVDVSNRKLGWDLTVTKAKPVELLHIEVKGVSGQETNILLTSNEMRNASENPNWKLAVVTGALDSRPKLSFFTAKKVTNSGKPLLWQITLRGI